VKIVQGAHFTRKIKCFSNQQDISKISHIMRLNPFVDEARILRVDSSYLTYSTMLSTQHYYQGIIRFHILSSFMNTKGTFTRALKLLWPQFGKIIGSSQRGM